MTTQARGKRSLLACPLPPRQPSVSLRESRCPLRQLCRPIDPDAFWHWWCTQLTFGLSSTLKQHLLHVFISQRQSNEDVSAANSRSKCQDAAAATRALITAPCLTHMGNFVRGDIPTTHKTYFWQSCALLCYNVMLILLLLCTWNQTATFQPFSVYSSRKMFVQNLTSSYTMHMYNQIFVIFNHYTKPLLHFNVTTNLNCKGSCTPLVSCWQVRRRKCP